MLIIILRGCCILMKCDQIIYDKLKVFYVLSCIMFQKTMEFKFENKIMFCCSWRMLTMMDGTRLTHITSMPVQ